jgi:hypothetical protein
MSFVVSACRMLALTPLLAALAGCGYLRDARQLGFDERSEFAAPQSRWPETLPSPVGANDAAPARPARYCYRTLAQADCYEAPNPERRTGYTGTYPTLNSAP